jgi:hypothetical protein
MQQNRDYSLGRAGVMGALLVGLLTCGLAYAQAPKYRVTPDTPVAPIQYHGLVPGLDTHEKVREVLGEPVFESQWYNYKLYYPADGRDGKIDVVHLHGKEPGATLADIEAATVPAGYETGDKVRDQLGTPEYELHMATWSLLDYSEKGLRFSLDANGNTTGVAYLPYGYRRVPEGERRVVDLRSLRQGEQPRPENPAPLDALQCGTAEREITPQPGWLNHDFTVNDPLFIRIAVFNRGDLSVALVGADVFGMGKQDLDPIRQAVQEQFGVDYLVFGMSHNHASGDTSGFYGYYPLEYVSHIQKQTIEGVGEAVSKLEPVSEFRVASKELPMDGTRVQGLFRNARNPGVLDPTISVMQALRADGSPITTMVNFACHTESIENGGRVISGDFPSFMCNQMKADGLGQPVFLNGALGGMVSGDNPERTPASAQEMGEKLARIVKVLSENAVPPANFAFNAETRRVEVPVTNQNFIPLFEEGPRSMHKGRVITDMTYVQIGEAQFITLPGELLPEVSFEILEHMQGFPRVLVGLGNDQLGYMVPPYDFRNDYYEETVSVGPAMATQVRDMAIRMLNGTR